MQTPLPAVRAALEYLDTCARAYADACVAHATDETGDKVALMRDAHDFLMEAAQRVAALN